MKDIVSQTIEINPKATYDTKSAPVHREVDDSKKYIRYSDLEGSRYNDRYPLTLLETVRSSNTATALYNTRARFVAGTGAANVEMGKFIVNPNDGTTVNDIITELSKDLVKQKQMYIWVKLNGLKTDIFSIERIAPQNARLGTANSQNKVSRVHYSPYAYGSRDAVGIGYDKSKTKPFYDEVKTAPNQILYVNADREYNEYYPYPLDTTQLNLFRTDAQITSFNYNNLKNNFFGGAIISLVGNPNKAVKTGVDKEGKDIEDTWGNVMANELAKTKVGADNAGNLTLLWTQPDAGGKAQPPVISAVESNVQSDMFSTTLADITDNIARFVQVPTILANIQVAGKLGSTDELINNIDLLTASTEQERKLLERTLNKLLKRYPKFVEEFKEEELIIQPLSMIRAVPDKAWATMTPKEQREYVRNNYNIDLDDDVEVVENVKTPSKEEEDKNNADLKEAGENLIAQFS